MLLCPCCARPHAAEVAPGVASALCLDCMADRDAAKELAASIDRGEPRSPTPPGRATPHAWSTLGSAAKGGA